MLRHRYLILLLAPVLSCLSLLAEPQPDQPPAGEASEPVLDGKEGRNLALDQFLPVPALKAQQTLLQQAKYPVVDVHTHFLHRLHHSNEQLDDFVALMDRNNIAICVSLDGRLGDTLDEHLKYLWTKYKDRFVVYTNINWIGDGDRDKPETWDCQRPDFARRTAIMLADAREQGVSGLKLFKQFGLGYKNPDGSLIKIDDPRWNPIWQACGELGMPVIIHTADPAAFFQPIDRNNERWEELHRHPDWSFYGDQFPSREELLSARNRVIERHPKTNFIGAHFANNPEDLAQVSAWLDKYPNLYVEPSSRIAELGRQPYTARKFFLKYADRILFGTDGPWPEVRIRYYWRFLETYDENFPYSEKEYPPQGLWRIHGLGLPEDVLKKIYSENAAKLIPGVKERVEKFGE
ncbi:MAG: amidohydrolase family protein [Pirellulales bacterium]